MYVSVRRTQLTEAEAVGEGVTLSDAVCDSSGVSVALEVNDGVEDGTMTVGELEAEADGLLVGVGVTGEGRG